MSMAASQCGSMQNARGHAECTCSMYRSSRATRLKPQSLQAEKTASAGWPPGERWMGDR
jgi:hypothetical protein